MFLYGSDTCKKEKDRKPYAQRRRATIIISGRHQRNRSQRKISKGSMIISKKTTRGCPCPLGTSDQKKKNENIVAELAERENECEEANKDAEELADLVRTKEEVMKTLQSKLAEAKKKMADLKAEIHTLRSSRPDEQQQQQRDSNCVTTHSLSGIHQRYEKVLEVLKDNSCSMANAFRLSGCPRSTLLQDSTLGTRSCHP